MIFYILIIIQNNNRKLKKKGEVHKNNYIHLSVKQQCNNLIGPIIKSYFLK
jgi:hypothetical protein